MGQYRTPIVTGDRVALAPHTDLWMAGCRFGKVDEVSINEEGFLRYMIVLDTGRAVWLAHDDLLGAVAGTPVGGAMPSTEGPGARIVGGMEPRHEMRNEDLGETRTIALSEAVERDLTIYSDEWKGLTPEQRGEAMDEMRRWIEGWKP